ncbi:MAG: hypothetical protein ABGW76_01490 [Mesonia sp.]|uniref:ATP-grasp domain-containing protein n=1 Tax=Mesonia sp. TaxID=1960830 RepID=UPI003241F564
MLIAIHHRKNSFSDRWINYCELNKLNYILVNCYSSNIIKILKDKNITHILWHYHHSSIIDIRVSNYVFNSAEAMGIKTFPDFATRWHFDDKVAQKYLFEAIGAPLVTSYVYYQKEESIEALKLADFPIVAKLRRGAGSTNVKLLNSYGEAEKYVNLMFDKGVEANSPVLNNLNQKLRIANKIRNPFELLKKTFQYILKNRRERSLGNIEKGYFYYQEFMPNNSFDTRVIVIGDRAFAIRRFTRKGDFKASGSGLIDYNFKEIDTEIIKIAFDVTTKMKAQCLAYDFVYDNSGLPKIIEVSFSFSMLAYDNCKGYWDKNLNFIKSQFNPQYYILKLLVK